MPSPLDRRYKQLKNRVVGEGGDPAALAHNIPKQEAIIIFAAYLGMTFPMLALDYDTPLDKLFARTEEMFPTLASETNR